MTATLIMEVLCVAGVLFMIRFLVALFRESKPVSPCCVVHLSSQPTQTEHDALGPITEAGTRSGRSYTHHQSRFKVIAGGGKSPVRRVG